MRFFLLSVLVLAVSYNLFLFDIGSCYAATPAQSFSLDRESVSKDLQGIIKRNELQTKLKEPVKTPEYSKNEIWKNSPNGGEGGKSSSFFNFLSSITSNLLYIVLVIISLAAIIFIIKVSYRGRSLAKKANEKSEVFKDALGSTERMGSAHDQAELMASKGNYASAMHILLLQSVSELRRQLNIAIAASLTSREILRYVRLSPEGKSAFKNIVIGVEVSYFGTHEPTENDYFLCRESFVLLGQALQESFLNKSSLGGKSE